MICLFGVQNSLFGVYLHCPICKRNFVHEAKLMKPFSCAVIEVECPIY